MKYFYIIGKDQEDYKVVNIDLEIFKQLNSLRQIEENLNRIACNFGYISDIKDQDIKLYNGLYKSGKVYFNSDTIKKNIENNLSITVIMLIYRRDNLEEPVGYICLEKQELVYISKKDINKKLIQITNITNNGALFDVKEAKLPKIKIEELKYTVGTRVKYQDKEYKIYEKNPDATISGTIKLGQSKENRSNFSIIHKDYTIITDKSCINVYQDELELLDKVQKQEEKQKIQKEESKLQLTFLNGHFTKLYNKYKGQEVMKKSYIIQVKLAKPGEKYYNKLEDAHYEGKLGDAVLIGTQNEEWTTSIENVCKKYTLMNGETLTPNMLRETPIKIKTIVGENAEKVFAFHIKQNKDTTDKYGIKTSWGAELTINSSKSEHGDGDWVVSYAKNGQIDENNLAVINGLVFKDTYQKWKETNKKEDNTSTTLTKEEKQDNVVKDSKELNNKLRAIINNYKDNKIDYTEAIKQIKTITGETDEQIKEYLADNGITDINPYMKFSEENTKEIYNDLKKLGEVNIDSLNKAQKSRIYFTCAEKQVNYNQVINSLKLYLSKKG